MSERRGIAQGQPALPECEGVPQAERKYHVVQPSRLVPGVVLSDKFSAKHVRQCK